MSSLKNRKTKTRTSHTTANGTAPTWGLCSAMWPCFPHCILSARGLALWCVRGGETHISSDSPLDTHKDALPWLLVRRTQYAVQHAFLRNALQTTSIFSPQRPAMSDVPAPSHQTANVPLQLKPRENRVPSLFVVMVVKRRPDRIVPGWQDSEEKSPAECIS